VLILTVLVSPTLPAAPPVNDEVDAYLATAAVPIQRIDGAWIDPFVSDRRVVLIGEETHGIAEHLALKGELGRRLIMHHGFTHVLIEDDVFKGDAISANLRAQVPEPVAPLMRSFFWCWNVAELHDFFDQRPPLHPVPIVAGVDVQTAAFALHALKSKARTEEQLEALETLEEIFSGGSREYAGGSDQQKADDLRRIDEAQPLFSAVDAQREFAHLERVHRVWAVASDHGLRMNARDRGMTESTLDVLHQDPDAKVVLFVHNAHGGYTPFYESFTGGVVPLARHLRDQGVRTLSIGAVFATGSTLLDPRAREKAGGAIKRITVPPADSQAEHWATIPHDRWLLDVRSIVEQDLQEPVAAFFFRSPSGHFDNYGPARPLASTYDLIVGYRTVRPATTPR